MRCSPCVSLFFFFLQSVAWQWNSNTCTNCHKEPKCKHLYKSWQLCYKSSVESKKEKRRSSARHSVCNSGLIFPASCSAFFWQCRTRRWCPASSRDPGWCTCLPSLWAGGRDGGVVVMEAQREHIQLMTNYKNTSNFEDF